MEDGGKKGRETAGTTPFHAFYVLVCRFLLIIYGY